MKRRAEGQSARGGVGESTVQGSPSERHSVQYSPPMEWDLHHEVRGTGEPLLLVHGTGSSLHVWDPAVERLAARRTVIAVDLPGFGASPPLTPSGPPPAAAGFAGVLTDFLGQLGHRTAHIAGSAPADGAEAGGGTRS